MSRVRSLDELLHHLPVVAIRARGWERDFARSVLKQARRPAWRPSPAQRRALEEIVEEIFAEGADLIEDDDR